MLFRLLATGLCLTLFSICASAQLKRVSGQVFDKQSEEPIAFASVFFKRSSIGVSCDSAGRFSFQVADWPDGDTLEIANVGYYSTYIPASILKDSSAVVVYLETLPAQTEAVVRVKYNRALWFWKKVIARKPFNQKSRFDNYSYEVYNKIEIDLNNIDRQKLEKNPALKPLNFIFNYTDSTSESKPFLPVYLTETISDYYYQKQPYRTREVIKASRAKGINNESVLKQLGATYQNIDVYKNLIPVLDKSFISPFSENGDKYYNFKLADTQYLGNRRLIHLLFSPKRKGENTFEGDVYVNDTTFAIQKITLRPGTDVNLNFVKGLTLIQEFKPINDSVWFLYKDKFVVDITPAGTDFMGLKAKKTTTYKKVSFNDSSITAELNKGSASEDIIMLSDRQNLPDSFWLQHRFEPLNKNEQDALSLLDTLYKNKTFNRYRNIIDFGTTGTKYIGNFVIGPWYYWLTNNTWEGTRVRFDLATNRGFSENWYFNGYLAYGFKDRQYKGKLEARYQFSREPWRYLSVSYRSDIDNGQIVYDQLGSDNLFASFLRKPGIPPKFQKIEEKKIEYFTETWKNFSFRITATNKNYSPLLNLPDATFFVQKGREPFSTFETSVKLRFAYQERFIIENFSRSSFGSEYPIVELGYAHGFQGVLNSSNKYDRLDLTISDYLKIPPYGSFYYNFFAGKVFGTVPYQLLAQQPGNDWYYYSKYSFNLMNRFEYVTDRYAGFNFEHNVGSGIFRYVPLTRKMKLRQFWEVKAVVGNLSTQNKQLNFVSDYPFKSLDGKLYMEVGTGIDNIFKFFRIDCIWRVLPQPLPVSSVERFGVFFGARFSF